MEIYRDFEELLALLNAHGVDWSAAWPDKLAGVYGSAPTYYLGRAQFIQNKRAAGRLKDLADVEALGEK